MSYDFYFDIDLFETIMKSNGVNIPRFWILPEKDRENIMEHYSKATNANKFFIWLQHQDCFTNIID